MITIIRGSDKNIIVRLESQSTGDPYDLTNVTKISASFEKEDDTCLVKLYLKKVGDIVNGSDTLINIDVTDVVIGMPIQETTGIPAGTTVLAVGANSIQMSNMATANAPAATIIFGDITILSPLIGKIQIALNETDTSSLKVNELGSFEMGITRSGLISLIQFVEQLNIVASLC